MTVITLGEAEQEFAESVDYYESNEAGLGAPLPYSRDRNREIRA